MSSPLSIIQKVILSLLLGMAIVLVCHRAVAKSVADQLVEVPSIQFTKRNSTIIACDTIGSSVAFFKARVLDDSERLDSYLTQASIDYLQWHNTLAALENQPETWPRRYFQPLRTSSQNLDSSASSIGAVGSQYQNQLNKFRNALVECYVANPALAQELMIFDKLSHDLLENQSVAANYVEQMQSNLSDHADDWRSYEGHRIAVPAGTFLPLQSDANSFAEAGGLLKDDGEILAGRLQQIVDGLAGLTPKDGPNKMVAAPLSRL